MQIQVKYLGGPLDGATGHTEKLFDIQVFFPPEERRIIAYRRDPMIAELLYIWSERLSDELTANYDRSKAFFEKRTKAVLRIEVPDDEPPPTPFGDAPIIGGSGLPEPEGDK